MPSNDNANLSSSFAGKRKVLIGVDIGGTKTAVSISEGPPAVLWREEFPTAPEAGPDTAIAKLQELIARALRDLDASPLAIGVSCGSPLDSARGIIQAPPNLPTWIDVPVTAILSEAFGVPCALENDANAGALAEHRYGAGRGCEHMVFLTLGTGLGAGLILNGQLFRGATSMAGEIGHVRLTPSGPWGHGKEGSVEGWASGGGIARYATEVVREAAAAGKTSSLTAKLDRLETRDVGVALEAGDELARSIVRDSGKRLGEALAILVDVLNPQIIVVGGLALRFGEALLQPAREMMHREALETSAAACAVVPAALAGNIGDIAALCVAAEAAQATR